MNKHHKKILSKSPNIGALDEKEELAKNDARTARKQMSLYVQKLDR